MSNNCVSPVPLEKQGSLAVIDLFAPEEVKKLPKEVFGIIEEAIAPNQSGRVKCLASHWPARFYHSDCQSTVLPNQLVRIVAMCGITMLVVP